MRKSYTKEQIEKLKSELKTVNECQDCTDCVIKQVVELCKSQQQEFDEEIKNGNYPDKYKFFKSGRADAGTEILSKFDIREVLE